MPEMEKQEYYTYTSFYMTIVAVVLIWYLQYHWFRRHLYRISSKVPGPRGYPVIGSSYLFMGSPSDIYNNIMKIFKEYSDLVKVWHGPFLVYGISKPEYIEKVLTSSKAFSKMYLYRYAVPLVGYGLFTAPVSIWKRHRKIIMPAFNQKILDGFVEIFVHQSTIMNEQLIQYCGKSEFDVFPIVSRCTLDIICETAMGIKVNAQTTDSFFTQWVDRLLEIMFLRMFVIWYHLDFIFKWTKLYKDQEGLLKKFHAFTDKVVKEKRIAFEQNNEDLPNNKRKAFLELLIELSTGDNKLTDEELRDEVNTFMIAGSDTTATTNSFIFVMLGMHPQIQDRVYEEVIDIVGVDRAVELQDLPLLHYTERVIKETLRLFPIGAFIVRDIDEDLFLEDDVMLPKGSSALLGIMEVQRNEKFWPEPLKFNPDRFLPEEVSKRHSFTYLPFSQGPRNCIGFKYAIMAMKSMVATVIQRFKFSTSYKAVEDIKLKTNLVLRPEDGFKLSVGLRNSA